MDFFAQEERAQRQTRLLFWLFGASIIATLAITYVILGTAVLVVCKPMPHLKQLYFFPISLVMVIGEILVEPREYLRWLWDAKLFIWITSASLACMATAIIYKFCRIARGGPAVAELLGGRRLGDRTSNLAERTLRNVVEEMAIASGMPVPEIYILDRERGINTFAAGHTREDVAIGVTSACLNLLTRDELQGVIAHEFSHILNGDTRLNMKLIGLAHALLWPTMVGRVLLRGTSKELEIGESYADVEATPSKIACMPIAFPLLFIGAIYLPFGRLIKSLICREREWLADAAAVQFTRNPAGIEGALKKVGGQLKQGRLDTPRAEIASHLYFVNSAHESWFSIQSTHPPLDKRILAIDPQFDGKFQHIKSLPSGDDKYDRIYEATLQRERAEAAAQETQEGNNPKG